MLYEMVELKNNILVQFLAVHALHWDPMIEPTHGFIAVDPEITHEDLVHLKRIAQRAREELERAKPGSAVWEAMRFILSSPIKGTEERTEKEPTWESPSNYVDYPEPGQTMELPMAKRAQYVKRPCRALDSPALWDWLMTEHPELMEQFNVAFIHEARECVHDIPSRHPALREHIEKFVRRE